MSLWLINNPFVLPVRPCRTLDQHCSMCLKPEELVTQLLPHEFRNLVSALSGYYPPMPCRQDSGSTVSVDKDKFQINFDIQQFKPEEISVKVTGDNLVVIEGKHEEKQDEHGSISKQF
ncbi:HSP20 domain containing protein, partial [Asbolus verrucosus]